MNWDALSSIADVVGAIAVVSSIFYLAIQVKMNTKAVSASASFDAAHSWAEFNEANLSLPDEHLELILRTYSPDIAIEDVSDAQYMRVVILHRTIFQKLEGQYYLYKHGFLEPSIWKNRRNVALGILNIPFYQSWWANELRSSTYSDEFVDALKEGEAVDTIGINTKPT